LYVYAELKELNNFSTRIMTMQEGSEGNVKLGSDLGNEANQFLQVSMLEMLSFLMVDVMSGWQNVAAPN
jgi:hypothetical protein